MDVELTVRGGVAPLTLNRPDSLNALTPQMLEMLIQHLDRVESDPQIRALIFTGAGRAFCAGADVKGSGAAPAQMSVSHARRSLVPYQQVSLKLYNLNKPVVCAVRGATVGIAWSFAMCADHLIASETTKFIPAFLSRATIPEGGMLHLLARLCGEYRAKEIMYLNRTLTGHEAFEAGLASKVVEDEQLMSTAQSLAEELAAGPTFSIGLAKQLFRATSGNFEAYLALELNAVALAVNSADATEGRQAFKEKRKPDFKGH
ncbi:enoyl-CoA hydratase/isomerase family protein [Pseudomonas sp. CG7]|uniref:enoyl-CoA hydratase/isomerase family protein n=1 Tax=Pseudomonas sp. CG7 TaxID=191007 RepID=UPI002033A3E9|nr:enoyl-CoA hydratase/isomerase family protein [Pseudomonas sp. CG7]MCM2459386.1 enoyl-CoA hydratase/isomerase family protein [Pseudomonas sp. CG7]